MSERTILITGGAGFIGSNFVEYWYNQHPSDHLIVLDALTYAGNAENIPESIRTDEERFEFWYGNVCNTQLVDTLVARSDVVVHFAAESHVARSIFDNKVFFETDVMGSQSVATAVVKYSDSIERFVHVSTSEVYGTAAYEPMDEEHPLNPLTPYASAKCGADRLVYSFVETYGIPAIIVRPFNQFGPKQHLEKVIPRFITSALTDQQLTIHGDGSPKRDWLYVEDTCQRIGTVVQAPLDVVQGEVFNLGSGEVYSVLEIAKMVLSMLDKPESLIGYIGDRLGQVDCHHSSVEKSAKILGISPGRPFQEGLRQTIQWYQQNEDWWRAIEWMKGVRVMTKSGQTEVH